MIRLRSLATFGFVAVTSLVTFGCADNTPAAPKVQPEASQDNLLASVVGSLVKKATTVTPVERTSPLRSDITVSKTIGVLGGTLSIPEAGLTVVVPALAVSKPTKFEVTARAGSLLAYDFEPHGTRFTTPLVVTQDLRVARVNRRLLDLGLSLGYYPDSDSPTLVTELLNVNVNLLGTTAVSTVWHFSGYIYASGRTESGSDSQY